MTFEYFGRRLHEFVSSETVNAVAVTILPVSVAVLSGEDAGSAYRAGGTGAEPVIEDDTALSERVNVWGFDDVVTVATRDTAPIVSDDKQNISILFIIHISIITPRSHNGILREYFLQNIIKTSDPKPALERSEGLPATAC